MNNPNSPYNPQSATSGERSRTIYPQSMNGSPQVSDSWVEDEISLHDILEILMKGKWFILASFLLLLSGVAAYTFVLAPEFEASGTLLVNEQNTQPQLDEMLGLEMGNRNIANEVEILKSRAIASRVAEEMMTERTTPNTGELYTVLETGEGAEPLTQLDVAQRLRGYITVAPVSRDVDMIKVTATSTQPEEAAIIVNHYATEFLDYNRTISRARMTASREFLDDITHQFRSDLELAEGELTIFLDEERVVAPDEQARSLIEQVMTLQQIQYETQYQLGMNQAELRVLEAEVDQIMPGLAERISSGDNVMIDRLHVEIAGLSIQVEQKYAKNPNLRVDPSRDQDLVDLLNQIEVLQEQLDERAARVVDDAVTAGGLEFGSTGQNHSSRDRLAMLQGLRRQIMENRVATSGLQARLDIVEGQLNETTSQLSDIPRKEIILNSLQRNLQTREQLFITLVEKLQEARIAEQSELGYIDIVDDAIAPESPVRPRVQMNLMLGAVLGLMFGVGLAFVRNAFDNKVRKPEDLRKKGYSVLSIIPSLERMIRTDFKGNQTVQLDGRTYDTHLTALLNPLSFVAEGYRRMRTNIQFSRPDIEIRTILVSGPGPGEGKSVTSLNLAITLAQTGRKTLYLDADLRRPVGHKMMGIKREPGLVDLLFQPLPKNLDKFATGIDDLYVITAGKTVPNPAEVLGSQKMRDLLANLKESFDVIIVDTPPILAVTDALAVASNCDAVVLVCSAVKTTWQVLERGVEALASVGVRPTGLVLNQFDPKAAYGGYGYGYGYGDYGYGYGGYYYGEKPKTKGVSST